MDMESKEIWIETILNSTQGITKVTPSEELFSKIQQKIQFEDKVSSKTIWLVAASIIVLIMINITAVKSNFNSVKQETPQTYILTTVFENNQIYQ